MNVFLRNLQLYLLYMWDLILPFCLSLSCAHIPLWAWKRRNKFTTSTPYGENTVWKCNGHTSEEASLVTQSVETICNAGDLGSIPGSAKSLGEGNGNPLQHSCLENSTDREAWWLHSMGLQRVGHDWVTNTFTTFEVGFVRADPIRNKKTFFFFAFLYFMLNFLKFNPEILNILYIYLYREIDT